MNLLLIMGKKRKEKKKFRSYYCHYSVIWHL